MKTTKTPITLLVALALMIGVIAGLGILPAGAEGIESAEASITSGDGTVTYYATYDEALAAWEDGTTLTLLAKVELDYDDSIEITGKTVTLDLNGNYLYVGTINIGSTTDSTGNLTICDSSTGGELWVDNEYINVYGTLTLQGGTLSTTVTVRGGTLNMTGGKIGSQDWAYGVEIVSGTANISDGEICGCYYGIYVGGGCLNISGSPTISAVNDYDEICAAIAITSEDASVTISGTPTFSASSTNDHYDFYFEKNAPVTLNTQPADGSTWSVYMETPGVFANPGEGVTLDASKFTAINDEDSDNTYSVKKNSDGDLLLCDCATAKATVSNGDGKTHRTTCACGEVTIEASVNCTGGTPTCTTLAKCEHCGASHGDYAAHDYESGFCTVCDAYEPAKQVTADNYTDLGLTADNYAGYLGYYAIANAGQLYWFADKVNSATTTDESKVNAVLVANITVNTGVLKDDGTLNGDGTNFRNWTPIGNNNTYDYRGTFDGNGHTVSGLYFSDSDTAYVGLIGFGVCATVKNVGVTDTYFAGFHSVGGLVGYSAGSFTGVENCYFMGTVKGKSYIGGVVGYNNAGKIENCYAVASVSPTGTDTTIGAITGCNFSDSGSTVTNCYYLETKGLYGVGRNDWDDESVSYDVTGQYEAKTTAQFATGEVAYLLNNKSSENVVWYQNIDGTDTITDNATPVLSGDSKVYVYYETGKCIAKYTNDLDSVGTYSTTPTHNVDTNGVCQNDGCDLVAAVGLETNSSGDYFYTKDEISDAITAWLGNNDSGLLLYQDIEYAKEITIENGVTLSLDLRNYKLTVPNGIKVSRATLSIDSETGYITNGTNANSDYVICAGKNAIVYLRKADVVQAAADSVDFLLSGGEIKFVNSPPTGTNYTVKLSDMALADAKGGYTFAFHYNDEALPANLFKWTQVKGYILTQSEDNTLYNISLCDHSSCAAAAKGFYDCCGTYQAAELVDDLTAARLEELGLDEDFTLKYNGYYAISTPGQLYWFADKVNNENETYGSAKAVLVKDITVNENVLVDGELNTNPDTVAGFRDWTPIGCGYVGSNIVEFKGFFDGNGHTISGLYLHGTPGVQDSLIALIGFSGGTTVKNVGVIDTYFYGTGNSIGGLGGYLYGSSKVENCYFKGTVTGAKQVGGIVGLSEGQIQNCYAVVKATATSTAGNDSLKVGAIVGLKGGTVTNCYYDSTLYTGSAVGVDNNPDTTDATGKTTAQFASGEVAWLLNGGDEADPNATPVWYQTLGEGGDETPVLAKDEDKNTVYYGYPTNGCVMTYANAINNYPTHNYDNDGFCKQEDHGCEDPYEPAYKIVATKTGSALSDDYVKTYAELNLTADYDGYYAIENAGQLYWFADKVNNDNSTYRWANAVLVKDITVNEGVLDSNGDLNTEAAKNFRDWTPIGYWIESNTEYAMDYSGTFDGNGHTISGLYLHSTSGRWVSYIALIGMASSAKVKNVGVIDTYFYGVNGNSNGGLVGYLYGNNDPTVENCYFMGTVTGHRQVGGVVGMNNGGQIKNCYAVAKVTATAQEETYARLIGGIVGYNTVLRNSIGTVTNCYYNNEWYTGSAAYNDGGTVDDLTCGKTTKEFESGEVAYLLNSGKTDGSQVWYQTLTGDDADATPKFSGGTVYRYYEDCVVKYTNDETKLTADNVTPKHDYDKDTGECNVCEDAQAILSFRTDMDDASDGMVTTYYDTLDEAKAAIGEWIEFGRYLKLFQNVEYDGDFTWDPNSSSGNLELDLDLNGYELELTSSTLKLIQIRSGVNLTITDSSANNTGSLVLSGDNDGAMFGVSGTLTLEGGTFELENGYVVDVVSGGALNISGKTTLKNGNVAICSNGTVSISDSPTIEGGVHAICCDGGSLTINGTPNIKATNEDGVDFRLSALAGANIIFTVTPQNVSYTVEFTQYASITSYTFAKASGDGVTLPENLFTIQNTPGYLVELNDAGTEYTLVTCDHVDKGTYGVAINDGALHDVYCSACHDITDPDQPHSNFTYTPVNADTHTKVCTDCGAYIGTEGHDKDENGSCDICSYPENSGDTEALNEMIRKLEEQIATINETLAGNATTTELETLKKELEESIKAAKATADAAATQDALKEVSDLLDSTITAAKTAHEALDNKISELAGKVAALKTATDELQKALADAVEAAGLDDTKALADAITALSDKITAAQTAADKAATDAATADAKLKSELVEKIEDADGTLKGLIDALTTRVLKLETDLATAPTDIAKNAADIVKLQETIATVQTTIATLQKKDTELGETIEGLQTSLKSAQSTLNAKIGELEEQIASLTTSLKNAKDELNKAIATNTTNISDLDTRVGILETKMADAQKVIDALEKTYATIGSVDTLKAELKEADKTLTEAIAALKTRVDNLESKLAATKSSLEQAINDLKTAKVDSAEYTAKVNALSEEITKAITTANTYTDTALAEAIAKAKAELQTAIDNLSADLGDKIDDLNTEIGKLQGKDTLTADQITKILENLTELGDLIAAVKSAAETNDTALRSELIAKIDALDISLTDDLKSQIAQAKQEAIDTAASALAAAKADLQSAISTKASTTALNRAVKELNEAIEAARSAAKLAATEADEALKAELLAAIEAARQEAITAADTALAQAKAELEELIRNGDTANETAISEAVKTLREAIDAATVTASEADAELAAALEQAIAAAKQEALAAVEAAEAKAAAELAQAVADLEAAMSENADTAATDLEEVKDDMTTLAVVGISLAGLSTVGFGSFFAWFVIKRKKGLL